MTALPHSAQNPSPASSIMLRLRHTLNHLIPKKTAAAVIIANAGVVNGIMPMANMIAPNSNMVSRLSNFNYTSVICA